MKNCPNCKTEIEKNFQICWNCSYSLTEKRIISHDELSPKNKNIACIRCEAPLLFTGNYKFHEGPMTGILGNLFEAFVNRESFDLYVCPKCGKVEFYTPV